MPTGLLDEDSARTVAQALKELHRAPHGGQWQSAVGTCPSTPHPQLSMLAVASMASRRMWRNSHVCCHEGEAIPSHVCGGLNKGRFPTQMRIAKRAAESWHCSSLFCERIHVCRDALLDGDGLFWQGRSLVWHMARGAALFGLHLRSGCHPKAGCVLDVAGHV